MNEHLRNGTADWNLAEGLGSAVMDHLHELIHGACMLAISLDEASCVNMHASFHVSTHIYAMGGNNRVPIAQAFVRAANKG